MNRFPHALVIAFCAVSLILNGCSQQQVKPGAPNFVKLPAPHATEVSTGQVTAFALTDNPASHKAKNTFGTATPKIFVELALSGIKGGDKLKATFICDNGKQASGTLVTDYSIDSVTIPLKAGMGGGEASLSKPTKGWPTGDYHVDVYINDQLKQSGKFTVR